MPSYTVQKGDTLSGIGAKYGVDWRSITGFRSGNPNLIYPGEVVSWGGSTPAPAATPTAAPAPTGPTAAQLAEQERNRWNNEVSGMYNKVGQFDASAKNPLDMYNAALEKLGIGDARTRVQGLRESLLNTENLIRNVEGDVSASTQEALVTEGQKRSLIGIKRQPLEQQAQIEGRNLEVALANYKDIMSEGKATTEMEYQYQKDQRQALMERLQVAIGQAKTADDRQRWQTEYDRLVAKDAEETRRWNEEMALKQKEFAFQQAQASRARSSGGGGGGGSSSGGGGTTNWDNNFISYIKQQMAAAPYSSRQVQDAWANAWFAQNGVTSTADRQHYWNLFNSTWNRPENPYSDPFYKR